MIQNKDEEVCLDYFRNSWDGLEKKLRENDYELVLILAGTNDIGRCETADDISENLSEIASICSRR